MIETKLLDLRLAVTVRLISVMLGCKLHEVPLSARVATVVLLPTLGYCPCLYLVMYTLQS